MATTVTDPSLEPTPPSAPGTAPPAPDQGTHHRGESQQQLGQRPSRPRSRRSDLVNMLFGRKIRTDQEIHERLGNRTALAVFASDALSSVAYATEEMLTVLLLGGAGALAFGTLLPLSLGIVALLVILVFSYRQTIKAYPSAGGAYIVTRDNFGAAARAGRRGRAAHRLHPHRRGAACRPASRRCTRRSRRSYPYRVPIAVVLHLDHRLDEPARREGVGPHVRGADVRLRRRASSAW